MKLSATITASSGRGYRLQLHEPPPTDFSSDFQVELEALSFYSEDEGDDVFMEVISQNLTTTLFPLPAPNAFEVRFSGSIELEVPDALMPALRQANRANGVDYSLELCATSTGQRLASGDDWEFLENVNVRLEL